MSSYTADALFMPKLIQLQQCLCEKLEGIGSGRCQCQIVPAPATIIYDVAMQRDTAWVGMTQQFKTQTFPQPYSGTGAATWAAGIAVGVLRCMPINTAGDPKEGWPVIADRQASDAAALRAAFECCFGSEPDEDQVSAPTISPIEVEGASYGLLMTFTLGS